MSTIVVYFEEFASEDYTDVKFELSHSRVYCRDLVFLDFWQFKSVAMHVCLSHHGSGVISNDQRDLRQFF